MLQRKNKKEGRLWQGVLLNRMISNGSSEEEMVEYKMALNNRKTLKMWGNNVPGKKSKGPKSIAYIFILPGNGALKCSREGIWLPLLCYCDCVPAEASSASHRKARSCLPWNRDQQWSWEFSPFNSRTPGPLQQGVTALPWSSLWHRGQCLSESRLLSFLLCWMKLSPVVARTLLLNNITAYL